jgi:thiaminase
MSLFERLKTEASAEWRAYTEHPFTAGLADGCVYRKLDSAISVVKAAENWV